MFLKYFRQKFLQCQQKQERGGKKSFRKNIFGKCRSKNGIRKRANMPYPAYAKEGAFRRRIRHARTE
jgi:hypothetical protein